MRFNPETFSSVVKAAFLQEAGSASPIRISDGYDGLSNGDVDRWQADGLTVQERVG
ncbi:MAG: hypothetical protein RMM98_12205 [Acidobacteriota bacterium]|nr:hypothetical protein [Blastocatellia bacterium]MDW8240372.1 hypothetical protein [Acidobacteriota bacterium]